MALPRSHSLKVTSQIQTQAFLTAKPVLLNRSVHSAFANHSRQDYLIRFSEPHREMNGTIGRRAQVAKGRMDDLGDWPPGEGSIRGISPDQKGCTLKGEVAQP